MSFWDTPTKVTQKPKENFWSTSIPSTSESLLKPKASQLQQESQVAQQEAKKANSFGGLLKQTVKEVGTKIGGVLPGAKALVESTKQKSVEPYKQFLVKTSAEKSRPLLAKTDTGYKLDPIAAKNVENLVLSTVSGASGKLPPSGLPKSTIKGILEKPRIEGQISQGGLPPNVPKPSSLGSILPPESDPVKKIVQALSESKPLLKTQGKLYSAERAQRVARVASVGERAPGEQGNFAQLKQLKGELPKVKFESLRNKVTQ